MSKYYRMTKDQIESDEQKIDLYILKPVKNKKPQEQTPGILWIHGGGYVTGMAKMIYISRAMNLVKKYGAVVVTPEYRLAPQAPYPAALHDCYAALKYIKEHAQQLEINVNQIMVGGESAGGGDFRGGGGGAAGVHDPLEPLSPMGPGTPVGQPVPGGGGHLPGVPASGKDGGAAAPGPGALAAAADAFRMAGAG